MSRVCAIVLCILLVSLAAAQDTVRPKADEKKAEPKHELPKAEMPPADEEEIDVHKTAERIAENAQKAGDRLKDKDPGTETRKIQNDVLKDIDALIKKAQQPPPPPMSSDMPPPMSDMKPPPKGGGGQPKSPMGMGGGGSPPPKMGGGGGGAGSDNKSGRRPRRERKPRGDSPTGDPMAGAGDMNPLPARPEPKEGPMGGKDERTGDGAGFGKSSPKRQNDKLADLYKDVWGHLPDRLRQEMDLYYREQFMPRYSELLRRYYAALAEQRKKGSEDR